MNLTNEEMLALIQMAQAGLKRISDQFIESVESEQEMVSQMIQESMKPEPTKKRGFVSPEAGRDILKSRAG